jgi:hypothetical protein
MRKALSALTLFLTAAAFAQQSDQTSIPSGQSSRLRAEIPAGNIAYMFS